MGVIRLNHRASLTSQLIQDKGWQGCQSLLETVDMRNMSWDSAINPSNGQIEKRVLLPGPKDNSNRKIFFHNCSQVRKLTTERLRQAASFVNAEMATRVTMAASRWQVRKGWRRQFLLVCEKQTNKQPAVIQRSIHWSLVEGRGEIFSLPGPAVLTFQSGQKHFPPLFRTFCTIN